jgi:hypothetical protein
MTIKYGNYDFKFDHAKFRNDVIAFLKAHKLKYHELDEIAGVGSGNTSHVINAVNQNHKFSTWLKIANAMDIDVRTYFILDIDAIEEQKLNFVACEMCGSERKTLNIHGRCSKCEQVWNS